MTDLQQKTKLNCIPQILLGHTPMDELERLSAEITSEADRILHDHGLLAVLGKYGNPVVVGSYVLGLMTWRDLDISLETNEMTEARFFELGRDLALCLKPRRMQYRNEFIGKTPNLPGGYYWGIDTGSLGSPDAWNMDIWVMDSQEMARFQKEFSDLRSRISVDNRSAILTVKHHFCQHPEYRKAFASVDIYHAVTEEVIKAVKEFSQWLRERKGIR